MAYASSTTYLLTRLQKKFSSCEPKDHIIIIINQVYIIIMEGK